MKLFFFSKFIRNNKRIIASKSKLKNINFEQVYRRPTANSYIAKNKLKG